MDLWLIALIVVGADLAAIVAMALIRRRAPAGGFFRDSQVAAGAFTVTGTIFAVMVGFVFLIAFQSYASARSSARTEAGAVAALFHAADAFPGPARGTLQAELICYSRAVVNDEWETMAEDRASNLVSHWEARLEATFERVRPVGITASNAQQNWFEETDARRGARRARLAEADPFVPTLDLVPADHRRARGRRLRALLRRSPRAPRLAGAAGGRGDHRGQRQPADDRLPRQRLRRPLGGDHAEGDARDRGGAGARAGGAATPRFGLPCDAQGAPRRQAL